MSLSLISFLFGAALGQRFKVLVLVPAMAIVMMLSIGAGIMNAQKPLWIVLIVVTASTCLQFGYFVGIGIRHFLAAAPSGDSSPVASAETQAGHATH